MNIAVFGRKFTRNFEAGVQTFFNKICDSSIEVHLYAPFYDFLRQSSSINFCIPSTFQRCEEINSGFDFFFSLGGDGTFLESVKYVRDTGVPIVGINTGRLGFLANVSQDEISESVDALLSGNYLIEERSIISFHSSPNPFEEFPFGLNEITVQKRDSSLLTIDTEINDNYLNTYWTDGLIISTPTGSTAYSMSVGGPIVAPDCKALIISPIASHNLTVRPVIITDNFKIKLKVESRSPGFTATIDSRSFEFTSGTEINIGLAPFTVKVVRFANNSFYNTLRKKLMWGADVRN